MDAGQYGKNLISKQRSPLSGGKFFDISKANSHNVLRNFGWKFLTHV
jgi:hypothetical protein